MNFDSMKLSESLLQVVRELGFEKLTPIQAQSIPHLLAGEDLIGQSKTGSGKTAAFALPLLEKINIESTRVQALILCPTRELCAQVAREIRKLGRRQAGLRVLILAGGQPLRPQADSLKKQGAHMVVGTPGRVLDHLGKKTLDLRSMKTLVLDEADRMLDMGFQEEMENILKSVPKQRQTIFFSATFPESIEVLSRTYQNQPKRVTIEETKAEAPAISQSVYVTDRELRVQALLNLLQRERPESALVFCNFKAVVSELTQALTQAGVSAARLHGDLEQFDRDRVMAKFRNHSIRVLVATDVAARGIDVEALDMVVNFELPAKPEIYVHRIGRTGRAGKTGVAVSFVTRQDDFKLQSIEEYIGMKLPKQSAAVLGETEIGKHKVAATGQHKDAAMETLCIGGGRKQKVRPGDILGALTGEAGGLHASDIGKIEIHDHFSYVAISKKVSRTALRRLQDGRIKGRKFRVDLVR